MKLKRILISQPKPESEKSPWFDIPLKHKVTLDFKPFIHVEGISAGDFRKQRIDIANYHCIILNSRNAVDHYFRMANELRYTVPEKNKYFCLTEAIALYLQKYIQYRKRKIFFAQQSVDELAEPIRKNKDEKFLFVCSDKATDKTTAYLEANHINYVQAIFYKTVSSDMRDMNVPGYDMIVFFSPNGIQSLFDNYPDFKQGDIRIGLFGTTTYAAAVAKGLRVDLAAPLPNAPSMTMALDLYIKEYNARNGDVKPMVNLPVNTAPVINIPVKPVEKTEPKVTGKKEAAKTKLKPTATRKKEVEKKTVKPKPVAKAKAVKKAKPKTTAKKSAKPAAKKPATKSTKPAKAKPKKTVVKPVPKKKPAARKAKPKPAPKKKVVAKKPVKKKVATKRKR